MVVTGFFAQYTLLGRHVMRVTNADTKTYIFSEIKSIYRSIEKVVGNVQMTKY